MSFDFKREGESGKILLEWRAGLSPGERAELKRCHDLNEAALQPSYHKLRYRLKPKEFQENGCVAVAALLAHVKPDGDVQASSFAVQMAQPKTGDNPRVSGLRFRRLLQCRDHQELFPALIRVLRMLDSKVDVLSLAKSVFWWNDRTKKDWAYDYYKTASKAQ